MSCDAAANFCPGGHARACRVRMAVRWFSSHIGAILSSLIRHVLAFANLRKMRR